VELQEFLIAAVTEGALSFQPYISRTDRIAIPPTKSYAVIVNEEPFDYNQVAVNESPTRRTQECIIFVMVPGVNNNELDEAAYKERADECNAKADEVIGVIVERLRTYNGIAGINFGRGEQEGLLVNSRPFEVMTIPVKATVIKSS